MRVRTRTTGAFDVPAYRHNKHRTDCGAEFETTSTSTSWTGIVEIKTIKDCITPGFHSLQRIGGLLPINPVSIETVRETRTAGSGDHFSKSSEDTPCFTALASGSSWGVTPDVVSVPPVEESILEQVSTEAVAKAKASVFDALTTIAEAKEAAVLLKTTSERLFRLAQRVRDVALRAYWDVFRRLRGRPYAVRKRAADKAYAQAFANAWLEYRYGWLPLVYTVQDAIKALESKYSEGSTIRERSSTTVSLNDSGTSSTSDGVTTASYTSIITGYRTYRAVAFAIVESNKVKFGFDPLITAWERAPFSFVVDWFIDVNSWLQAWTPFAGARSVACSVSVKTEYNIKKSATLMWGGPLHDGTYNGNDMTEIYVKSYERSPSGAALLPSWNPRLTPERLLDSLALLLGGKRAIMSASR